MFIFYKIICLIILFKLYVIFIWACCFALVFLVRCGFSKFLCACGGASEL